MFVYKHGIALRLRGLVCIDCMPCLLSALHLGGNAPGFPRRWQLRPMLKEGSASAATTLLPAVIPVRAVRGDLESAGYITDLSWT